MVQAEKPVGTVVAVSMTPQLIVVRLALTPTALETPMKDVKGERTTVSPPVLKRMRGPESRPLTILRASFELNLCAPVQITDRHYFI